MLDCYSRCWQLAGFSSAAARILRYKCWRCASRSLCSNGNIHDQHKPYRSGVVDLAPASLAMMEGCFGHCETARPSSAGIAQVSAYTGAGDPGLVAVDPEWPEALRRTSCSD
jgi:hypothetical protein